MNSCHENECAASLSTLSFLVRFISSFLPCILNQCKSYAKIQYPASHLCVAERRNILLRRRKVDNKKWRLTWSLCCVDWCRQGGGMRSSSWLHGKLPPSARIGKFLPTKKHKNKLMSFCHVKSIVTANSIRPIQFNRTHAPAKWNRHAPSLNRLLQYWHDRLFANATKITSGKFLNNKISCYPSQQLSVYVVNIWSWDWLTYFQLISILKNLFSQDKEHALDWMINFWKKCIYRPNWQVASIRFSLLFFSRPVTKEFEMIWENGIHWSGSLKWWV